MACCKLRFLFMKAVIAFLWPDSLIIAFVDKSRSCLNVVSSSSLSILFLSVLSLVETISLGDMIDCGLAIPS